MKQLVSAFVVSVALLFHVSSALGDPMSLYDLSAPGADGTPVPLAKYRGQVSLVVNTASECGFTPQYEGLQELFQRYQARGFVVLAFPSNDFGGQEPGSNAEIQSFCQSKFGVTFPVFGKTAVKGEKSDVYRYLTEQSSQTGEVLWNFEKFLVGRDGKVIDRFRSITTPTSSSLTNALEEALGKQ